MASAVRGWPRRLGPQAVSRGVEAPQLPDPAPPLPELRWGWGGGGGPGEGGSRGGEGRWTIRRRPPPSVPTGVSNKAALEINSAEHPKDAVVMEMGQREEARDGRVWAKE